MQYTSLYYIEEEKLRNPKFLEGAGFDSRDNCVESYSQQNTSIINSTSLFWRLNNLNNN